MALCTNMSKLRIWFLQTITWTLLIYLYLFWGPYVCAPTSPRVSVTTAPETDILGSPQLAVSHVLHSSWYIIDASAPGEVERIHETRRAYLDAYTFYRWFKKFSIRPHHTILLFNQLYDMEDYRLRLIMQCAVLSLQFYVYMHRNILLLCIMYVPTVMCHATYCFRE